MSAQSILDIIKQRQQNGNNTSPIKSRRNIDTDKLRSFINKLGKSEWTYESYLRKQEEMIPQLPQYEPGMGSKDWLRFSKIFIEGAHPDSGLTNQEMIEYIRSSYYPNKEFDYDPGDFLVW